MESKGKTRSKNSNKSSPRGEETAEKSPLNGESAQEEDANLPTESDANANKTIDNAEPPDASPSNSEKTSEKTEESVNNTDLLTSPTTQSLGKGKRARIPNKRYSDITLSPQSSSSKSAPTASPQVSAAVVLLRDGEKNEKIESESERESTSSSIRSDTNSPQPHGKKKPDLCDPQYLKPFDLGWKRELVYRCISHNRNKRDGDIYYYTPEGRKLRSMREIGQFISGSGELSISNFSFFKEPIGLNDPSKEIIREANPQGRGKLQKPVDINNDVTKAIPAVAKSPAPSSSSQSPPQENKTNNRKRSAAPSSVTKKTKSQKKAKLDDSAGPSSANESPTPSRRTSRKIPAKINTIGMETKPNCSIHCEGVMGMVPTLQCRLCLCLYHYQCMGLSPHIQIQGYVCKNCQLEHGQGVAASATICLPPPKVDPTPPPPPPPPPQEHQSLIISPTNQSQQIQPNFNNQDGSIKESKSLVGAVTSWLPHSSTIVAAEDHEDGDGGRSVITAMPRPQNVEYLAGRKFLVIPKHNIVAVSPNAGLGARIGFGGGVGGEAAPRQQKDNLLQAMEAEGIIQKNTDGHPETMESAESPRVAAKRRPAQKTESTPTLPTTTKQKNDVQTHSTITSVNLLQNLSFGYDALRRVFQYLNVQDLLRAGQVCTLWRDIASHPSLWRTVRMKNSQIHSFEGMANSLSRHGTVHLDLRKMLLPQDGTDDMWLEFSLVIHRVHTLRQIDLCRCPASVVEQLGCSNRDLTVINAVTIKCESIGLDMLASLKNLKELRIRSTSGMSLRSDITSLKDLTHLTVLSLTSIKDLCKMDLTVIASLTNLEFLDLGDCVDFPAHFGPVILSKLNKLEKLRLEKGQNECHTLDILTAVKKMPHLQQLELVNFELRKGFDEALGACTNIKKLLIIPDYLSQSATSNHLLLKGISKLQHSLLHFVWGITLELLRVTELFIDEYGEATEKSNGESLPVLGPVPLLNNEDTTPADDGQQVRILSLSDLQQLFSTNLPSTRVKILKIPYHATWRQSISDMLLN